MHAARVVPKLFAAAAAVLLGAVAVASIPSAAYAGDDAPNCPGTRCTGRTLPICCDLTSASGNPDTGQVITEMYYFPSAT